MDNLLYSQDHLWFLRLDNGNVRFGFTKNLLLPGCLHYLRLPTIGQAIEANSELGILETDKCTVDIRLPFAVKIVKVNDAIYDNLKKLREDEKAENWLCEVKLLNAVDLDSLMTAQQYSAFCEP